MSATTMVVSSFRVSCSLWMALSTRDAATTGVVFRMSFAMRACGPAIARIIASLIDHEEMPCLVKVIQSRSPTSCVDLTRLHGCLKTALNL